MERWIIEERLMHNTLLHFCPSARPCDTEQVLRQDIGGGYVRCERCGDKFLPPRDPTGQRILLRLVHEETSRELEQV